MNETLRQLMQEVGRLTRTGLLHDATAAIQERLGGLLHGAPAGNAATTKPSRQAAGGGDAEVIDVETRVVDAPEPAVKAPRRAAPAPEIAESSFVDAEFSNAAGTRPYKLYTPPGAGSRPLPLVVMLHGCTQNPDDFAAGTRMNELAAEAGWYVLYPGQTRAANGQRCWNWFNTGDQQRDRGETSLIAEMTRHVVATHAVDPRRVYIAGLSAGGAMASTLGAAYPDLYAAVGVHSGLAPAAAHDMASAFAAMAQGPGAEGELHLAVPVIVFHGDRDTTVHPCNGHEVIARARPPRKPAKLQVETESGATPGGLSYTRTLHRDGSGRCDAELWLVHGGGHAWFGGSADGSYTEPRGPDASLQMLRFFAEHPRPA